MMRTRSTNHSDFKWLYRLLKERDSTVNISHRRMPSYVDHVRFCKSYPYDFWLVAFDGRKKVGHCYVTRLGEIGVFVEKKYHGRGYGSFLIEKAISLNETGRNIANINPKNKASISLFKKRGFKLIQNTYELMV